VSLGLGFRNEAGIFDFGKIRWIGEPLQERNATPFGTVAEDQSKRQKSDRFWLGRRCNFAENEILAWFKEKESSNRHLEWWHGESKRFYAIPGHYNLAPCTARQAAQVSAVESFRSLLRSTQTAHTYTSCRAVLGLLSWLLCVPSPEYTRGRDGNAACSDLFISQHQGLHFCYYIA
jgi:hypothetical protein